MSNDKTTINYKNSPNVAGDANGSHFGDVNIVLQDEKVDLEVIDKIFESVVRKIGEGGNTSSDDKLHLHLNEKIKLNFQQPSDREAVEKYFNYALTKIPLIEERLQKEEVETQKDIQSYIFGEYYKLKSEGKSNIGIMHSLFSMFVPSNKKEDVLYQHLSKAFVLFFFDDCTIFEKTKKEE